MKKTPLLIELQTSINQKIQQIKSHLDESFFTKDLIVVSEMLEHILEEEISDANSLAREIRLLNQLSKKISWEIDTKVHSIENEMQGTLNYSEYENQRIKECAVKIAFKNELQRLITLLSAQYINLEGSITELTFPSEE